MPKGLMEKITHYVSSMSSLVLFSEVYFIQSTQEGVFTILPTNIQNFLLLIRDECIPS